MNFFIINNVMFQSVKQMKELFINSSFNFINKHQELDHYNEVKIKYGLEVMYSFITKTIAILVISLILGFLVENIFVLLFYGLLRTFAHGIHAKSNKNCWFSTMITYLLTGIFCKYAHLSKLFLISFSLLTLLIVILFAPSDTIYRPIRNKAKRIRLKVFSLISVILLSSLLIYSNFPYKNSVIVAFILCIVAINPITYKILKMPRDNYKN